MKQFEKRLLAASIAALCLSTAWAEEKKMPEKPGVPTLGQIMEATGISVTGYVDTSYTYLSGAGAFTSGAANRVFDTERRSFNLNALDLTISALPSDGFGGMVNLTAGSDAKVIASAGTDNSATVGGPTAATDEFDVTQAYVHYAARELMVIGGKYVTASGAEVIKSPSNTNFSRSILFGYAIPFTHTGVRAYFTPGGSASAPDGKWTFIAGINNGWDVLKESQQLAATDGTQGLGKTLELGANGALGKSVTLSAVYYSGNESGATSALVPATSGRRDLLDLVATINVMDNLSVVLNYDTAKQEGAFAGGSDAKWNGLAAYVNYKLSEQWRLSVRAEQFDDKDGYRTGVVQKWSEATATLAFMPTSKTELRLEGRHDRSNETVFVQPDGNVKKSQSSIGLEGIYKF